MRKADAALRNQTLRRVHAGEKVATVAADSGISRSTVYRWRRESRCAATDSPVEGYVGDIT
ncbi:helix-turn-helix domain-containing protein, partial [Mycobacterium paraense]